MSAGTRESKFTLFGHLQASTPSTWQRLYPQAATKPETETWRSCGSRPADFVVSVKGAESLIDQASLVSSDAINGLDPDMVRMIVNLKTPLIRFGGNFTSGYHWREVSGYRKNVSACQTSHGGLSNTTLSVLTSFSSSANW